MIRSHLQLVLVVSCALLLPAFVFHVPRTWDEEALNSSELPLADSKFSPVHVSDRFYYNASERPIYKSYKVYAPGREPGDYWQQLQQAEPEIVWGKDAQGVERRPLLRTESDWIRAGELVFDAAISYSAGDRGFLPTLANVRDPKFYERVHPPASSTGEFAFGKYVIREKGKVEFGQASCGMCHTRVLPDGAVVKGAQGNLPFDRAVKYNVSALTHLPETVQNAALGNLKRFTRTFFGMPWKKPDPADAYQDFALDDIVKVLDAIPPGVIDRQGSSALYPVQVPDLIGIKDRHYLDHTGLQRHRGPADLMRYGALNQDMNVWARYGSWIPASKDGTLPPPDKVSRYSDEQLYALAVYLYSLQPPSNPNRFDKKAAAGQKVFEKAGCAGCHSPPLYTNNKLTLAKGFAPPADAHDDIMAVTVGTDPRLALETRRGTGFYKVPSLKGLWYRGPLEHGGSVAALEDWFDPARLNDAYVPTGFVGYKVEHRAVPGHEFGLNLTVEDRAALIAFLRTL